LDGNYQLDTTSSEVVHQQVFLEMMARVVSRVHMDDHDQVCENVLGSEIFGVTQAYSHPLTSNLNLSLPDALVLFALALAGVVGHEAR
jgi:hypothetical protein